MAALAAQPVITGVSIPNASMKINDVVTVTITVQADSATYALQFANHIGNYTLGSLVKVNNTIYEATFTITEGGTDYAAGDNIPTCVRLVDVDLKLYDTWTADIVQANDPIDGNQPTDPTPTSSSHTVSVWDNDDTVDIQVSGAGDPGGSGVDGFEIEWDQSATWTPTKTKGVEETWTGGTFTATDNGDWYFHIATVDNAGNWTSTEHLGPFQIDVTLPSVPANLSPANGTYTNDTSPTLSWDASTDTGGSGMRDTSTYRYVVEGPVNRSGYTVNTIYTPTLAEGVFVWRVRARDNAGNNSDYTVDRTLTIDITDPIDPTPSSSSHTVGVVSNDTTVDIDIAGASDPVSNGATSGVDGFDYAWDQNAAWTATEMKDQEETWTGGTFTATSDGDWYFHIATLDNAGNWTGTEHLGPFQIDTDPPAVTGVVVDTDPMYEGDLVQQVTVTFNEAMDTGTDPTITFGAGTFASNSDGAWTVGDTVWTETFTLTDNNEEIAVVTVDVTGAKDAAGNDQEAYAEQDEFDIDTVKPSVNDVDVDTDPMYEGALVQQVTVTFDEAMDTGTDPTITFGAGTFTSNSDGAWTVGDTVWTETFELTDNNEEIAIVTVDVTGAKDAANNDQEACIAVDEFDIDTLAPTVSSITRDDPNPTRAAQVYFDVNFSESVTGVASGNFSIDATGGQVGATVDSTGGSGTSWWVLVNTVDDGEGTLSIDLNLNLTNITDAAGNEQVAYYTAGEVYDVDRLDPAVTSVSVDDVLISDGDAGGTFTVTVDFNEAMNQAQDPTLVFDPTVGTTLAIVSDSWTDTDTYTATYNVSDGNVDHNSVTVDVTNAEDVLGNVQSDYTPLHEFEIDTENPTVEAVTSSVALINDAVAAGGTFTIEVEFSETMDTGTQSAISFAPSVASTLSFGHGAWSMTDFANDTYTATYNVTDAGVEIDDVAVDVTGAKDAAGNDQQDYTPENEFNIDTLNPTVTSVSVNDTLITDSDAGSSLRVTVDFSEVMDQAVNPAILFDLAVATTLMVASTEWENVYRYRADYVISDGNVDVDSVTIDVTGAKDSAENDQQNYTPVHEFEIDTLNPAVTIDQASTQVDPTNSSPVVFTAVFDEPINDATFTNGDVTIGGTATTGAVTVTEIAPNDDTTFNVSVVVTGDGTVTATIPAGGVEDSAGNTNTASTSTDNEVIYDTTKPDVTIDQASAQADPTNGSPVVFTAVFDEPINDATFTNGDVTIGGTATTGAVTVTEIAPNDDTTFSVSVVATGDGTVTATIPAGGVEDSAGNTNTASTSTDNTVTCDTTPPQVSSVTANPTQIVDTTAGIDKFTVTTVFSETMDAGTTPTLTFAPDVTGGGTPTLSNGSGAWSQTTVPNDTFTMTYDVADRNLDIDSVTVDVSGAKDSAGNDQQDYMSEHKFEIDTLNPTITSITSSTPNGCYDVANKINVTVSFSENITLVGGTLDVTLDTGDVVSVPEFGPATSASTTYTIGAGDNSCDLDATNVVLNGGTLQDDAGNDAAVSLPGTTIANGSDIVVDTTAPVINPIASDKTVECDGAGNITEINTWLNSHGGASATDNCGGVTWTDDFTTLSDDCGETGSALVTFTATDCCGLSSMTTATFTIEDTTPPSISCPADVTVECTGSTHPDDTGYATGSDTCGDVTITYSDTSVAGCGHTEIITRTWTATDECGNNTSCDQIITVVDTTSPVIEGCPADIEQDNDPGVCNAAVSWIEPTARDTCGSVSLVSTASPGDVFPVGTTTVTYTATDECGNVTTCSFDVMIVDVEPPTTVFVTTPPDPDNNPSPLFEWIGADNNGCTASPQLVYSTNLDDAGWSGWSVETTVTIGPLSEGWHTYKVCAMDEAGNIESTVTYTWFIDLTAPVITIDVPGDGAEYVLGSLVLCSWKVYDDQSRLAFVDSTVADGDAIDTITPGDRSFFVEARDLAGNSARVDRTYRVVYVITPSGGGDLDGGTASFLDRRIEGEGVMVGNAQLAAVYTLGETIGIAFSLTDENGTPVTNAAVSVSVVQIFFTDDGKEYVILSVELIPYDAELEIYTLSIETLTDERALEIGYYDLWLWFNDGTQEALRIEIVSASP